MKKTCMTQSHSRDKTSYRLIQTRLIQNKIACIRSILNKFRTFEKRQFPVNDSKLLEQWHPNMVGLTAVLATELRSHGFSPLGNRCSLSCSLYFEVPRRCRVQTLPPVYMTEFIRKEKVSNRQDSNTGHPNRGQSVTGCKDASHKVATLPKSPALSLWG